MVCSSAARKTANYLRCHICSGSFPPGSFIRQAPGLIVSSPELTFLQMAAEFSAIDLVALGFELCGAYRLDKDAEPERGFRNDQPLTSARKLRAFIDRATGARGLKNARWVLRYLADGSASPMETIVTMLLTLPYRLGGYHLPVPRLNHPVAATIHNQQGLKKLRYYSDLYWPDRKLAVEYDSNAYHTRADLRTNDHIRRNILSTAGISVITVSWGQASDLVAFHELAEVLSKQLRKRMRCPVPEFNIRAVHLRDQLLPRSMSSSDCGEQG
jgi:very-short-patch-repair endonuclease